MKQEIHKYQTSDYMEWDVMLSLIRKLYRDGNYRMSLLIGCGCFFGLRISDILTLTWYMLLDDDKFTLNEKKTNKRRVVKINADFQQHINNAMTLCILQMTTKSAFYLKRRWFTLHNVSMCFSRKSKRSII